VRTVWSDRPLDVPRSFVVDVTQLPGFVTFVDDDFEDDLNAWKLRGGPSLSDSEHTSGKRSLLLDAAGQSAEYVLAEALEAGRCGINFLDPGSADAGRWLLEAEFAGPRGARVLQVTLAGDTATYTAAFPEVEEKPKPLARQAGWHRLMMEFTAHSWALLLDEKMLWESDRQGPGALRKLRLSCAALPDKSAVTGKLWLDEFSLARPVEPLRRPARDVSQDELWLLSGDQLFGRVLRADRKTIDFEGRSGRRSVPWGEVRGIGLRHVPCPLRTSDGEHVRLQLHSGAGAAPDEVEGVLRSVDRDQLRLLHAAGEVTILRDRWRQLQGCFVGRRLEVDNGLHHLGREVRAALPLPQPEGLSFRRQFTLDAVPDEVRLVVEVAHLKGPGDGRAVAQALERGGLRTEVLLNGRLVDYLNRYGERSAPEPRWITLTVPRGLLRAGENVLELRQTLDRPTGQYEDCMICGIAIEMPR